MPKAKAPTEVGAFKNINPGSVLASRAVAGRLLSPLKGLTAVFEMGTGVSPSPWPPELNSVYSLVSWMSTFRQAL